MEILVAQKASFTYQNKSQSVKAVRDVSCGFELGKCYAIVGKSGSGKTTLLSLLAGLELPTEGKILYDGIATSEMDCDDYRKDHAAVIYQHYNLFPLLTAEENVLYSQSTPAQIVDAFSENWSLTDEEQRLLTQAEHLQSYGEYLERVQEQAHKMQASSIFNTNQDSFTYRNIIKTAKDFTSCTAEGIRLGNDRAI